MTPLLGVSAISPAGARRVMPATSRSHRRIRALSCCNAIRAVKVERPLCGSVEALPLRLHQGRS